MPQTLDRADNQFLGQMHRLGPGTVLDLGQALGVTATAIRQRLSRLEGAGMVARRLERAGRGRPHYVYELTPKGLRELGDNYGDLALILWREIHRIPDRAIREPLVERVRDALVRRFGPIEGHSLDERLRRFRDALAGHGYDVEIAQENGLPILRENSCPYQELADEDRGICDLEQEVFQRVLGMEVKLTHCCKDGHRCCEFEVAAK
jgi:predicted ArsR family transcriptional regulator